MAGDVAAWLDTRLAEADRPGATDRVSRMREAVIGPLRHVYGASDKVLSIALSSLLLGGGANRARWAEVESGVVQSVPAIRADTISRLRDRPLRPGRAEPRNTRPGDWR